MPASDAQVAAAVAAWKTEAEKKQQLRKQKQAVTEEINALQDEKAALQVQIDEADARADNLRTELKTILALP